MPVNKDIFQCVIDNKNKISSRYDIETVALDEKSNFIFNFLLSHTKVKHVSYKFLFWESKDTFYNYLKQFFEEDKIIQSVNYKNGTKPGILYLNFDELNALTFSKLCALHLNYEQAIEPSFNVRLQVYIEYINHTSLLDIYDDRGFNFYVVLK